MLMGFFLHRSTNDLFCEIVPQYSHICCKGFVELNGNFYCKQNAGLSNKYVQKHTACYFYLWPNFEH